MTDNITPFPGRAELPENPITLVARPLGFCHHAAIELDEHSRTVRCADPKCGAVLDPFDFLRHNAILLRRAWAAHREVSQKASEVAARVTALKAEEKRLRGRVATLQKKPGLVVNTRGD